MKEAQKDRLSQLSVWIVCLALLAGLLFFAMLGSTNLNEVTDSNRILSTDGRAYCYQDLDKGFVVVSSAVLTWIITSLLCLSSYVAKAWKSLKPFWFLTLFASGLSLFFIYRCFELVRYSRELETFCS